MVAEYLQTLFLSKVNVLLSGLKTTELFTYSCVSVLFSKISYLSRRFRIQFIIIMKEEKRVFRTHSDT